MGTPEVGEVVAEVGILEVVVTPGEGAILAEVGEVIPHLLRKTT